MTGDAVAGTSVRTPDQRQRSDADRFADTTAGPALDRLADLARHLLGTGSAFESYRNAVQSAKPVSVVPLGVPPS